MDVERIEEWVGREVVDPAGESIGKLEEIYYRGSDPVLAEIKPGLLARKRVLVPLAGASVARDFLRVDVPADKALREDSGGSGFKHDDLRAVADHYGAAHTYRLDELESSTARAERIRLESDVREKIGELDEFARRRSEEAAEARRTA